ncbi:AraC family transcriptional regulator [Ahrensia sp. 13_GOM-1096m]|uniref:helix-turn-helix domain-containing protein n=1 Tax=Ahrensia sp. 13_GOM-1096m TaxID=1380380 RepID=UPI000479DFF1|nr:helix-turn-helix transcriptional regulator [Ahrensia sp. 13_GOM-1096m]
MIEIFSTTVLLSMSIGVAVVCIGLVIRGCIADAKWPSHLIALTYFFVIISAEAAELLNQSLPDEQRSLWLQRTTLFFVPSLGACIWFYVRGLTSRNVGWALRDLWHLVPIAICIVGALPYLSLPEQQRTIIMTAGGDLLDPTSFIAIIFMLLAWIAWITILILYGVASMSRLIKHRRAVRDLYSKVDGVSLTWLHVLITIVVTFTVLVLITSVYPAFSSAELFSNKLVALFYFCVVLVVGMFGVLQKNTMPSWSELDTGERNGRRYARSALQDKDLTRIARKLDVAMQDTQLWKNPNLLLIDLANVTGVSQNNISQTLNEHLGVNFYDYVNGWRIKAACADLRSTDRSVLTISENAGFNAKSTFNAAFKKVMGQTPRQYRIAAAEGVTPRTK